MLHAAYPLRLSRAELSCPLLVSRQGFPPDARPHRLERLCKVRRRGYRFTECICRHQQMGGWGGLGFDHFCASSNNAPQVTKVRLHGRYLGCRWLPDSKQNGEIFALFAVPNRMQILIRPSSCQLSEKKVFELCYSLRSRYKEVD